MEDGVGDELSEILGRVWLSFRLKQRRVTGLAAGNALNLPKHGYWMLSPPRLLP